MPDQLLPLAAEVIGSPVALVDDLSFSSRATVVRVAFGRAETAIVKMPFEPSAFANEYEALRLLPADVRPALIGSEGGVLVMEDLGPGPSLADLLLGPDADAAHAGLHAWARTLGRALGATLRVGAPSDPDRLDEGLGALVALAGALGVAVPAGVEDDVSALETAFSASSPWLAYCPGDTCPDNNRVLADGSVKLFDFEGSGWRHAATEAAYCRAPFCTCWCLAALPAGVTASMEGEFLDAMDPPHRDRFVATIGLAGVWWTLRTFDHFRRFVDRPVGPAGRAVIHGRQYLVLRLDAVRSEEERIPALAALAGGMRAEVVRRWPDAAPAPGYPAFL